MLSFLLSGCAVYSKVDRGGFSFTLKAYDEEKNYE